MNTIYNDLYLMPVVLNLFDGNTNTTLDAGLSDEMKTYYSMRLINLAEPELIHDQFGQKHPIPKNSGKTIEFRKYDSLPKALTPLTEGVTPAGQKLSMGVISAVVPSAQALRSKRPRSRYCEMFSVTMMELSIIIPKAKMRPDIEMMLSDMPNR